MKRVLASLVLGLSLATFAAPLTIHAEDISPKSSSSFDVFDIFDTGGEGESQVGEDNLTESLLETAEREKTSPIGALLLRAINILSLLVGTFAFVIILIGGITFITAGGNDAQIDKAKNMLPQAIIGLVLAMSSYLIVTFVLSFLY